MWLLNFPSRGQIIQYLHRGNLVNVTLKILLLQQNSTQHTWPGKLKHTHLQMRPDKGLLASVVEVVPHQEVQQLGGLGPDGAQLGVAAFQDLIAQGCTHVRSPLIERWGKLEGRAEANEPREVSAPFSSRWTQENGWESRMTFPGETTYLID